MYSPYPIFSIAPFLLPTSFKGVAFPDISVFSCGSSLVSLYMCFFPAIMVSANWYSEIYGLSCNRRQDGHAPR